MTMLWCEKRIG